MAKKQHAYALVMEQGLATSADAAKRLIMAGKVFIMATREPVRVNKPGDLLSLDTQLCLQQERFVSRGGYKLLTAIQTFSLPVTNAVCLDAGASTGGFTDCLLQHGAAKVYAVDVGKNQLHERLQKDKRVISLEGVNLRLAPIELIAEPIDIMVADVSFISLTCILAPCLRWMHKGALVAALIKPQFEVAVHETVRGVVRDPHVRDQAIERVLEHAKNLGLVSVGLVPSALKGPKGNQEYIAVWRYQSA